jgi:hypothetical protein
MPSLAPVMRAHEADSGRLSDVSVFVSEVDVLVSEEDAWSRR